MGHPLVGDKKYGATRDPLNRLGLHANKLEFVYRNKKYIFDAPLPKIFENLI